MAPVATLTCFSC